MCFKRVNPGHLFVVGGFFGGGGGGGGGVFCFWKNLLLSYLHER